MNIVLDTNILISATLWEGSVAQKLLLYCIQENISLFSTTDIFIEYQKVLIRDFKYTEEEVNNILKKIISFTRLVIPKKKIFEVREDPDDNKIIECAIESQSTHIITYDKHLLRIQQYEEIQIITPEEFLRIEQEKKIE